MTITEFIAKLEQMRAEHGDLEVAVYDRREGELCEAGDPYSDEPRRGARDYPEGQKVAVVNTI